MRRNYSRIFTAVAFAVVSLSATIAAFGQTEVTKRVRFPAGRSAAVVKGTLPKGDVTHVYILRATAGQRVKIGITFTGRGDAEFSFKLPSGENVDENSIINTAWEGELPQTGDYKIKVFNPAKIRGITNYTLKINLER